MAAVELIAVCASAQLVDGGTGVRFRLADDPFAVGGFAVRCAGRVAGYLNRCAHQPMELDWIAGHFFDAGGTRLVCATHGAEYDAVSGHCRGGPCSGRGLQPLAMVEQDGIVYWKRSTP